MKKIQIDGPCTIINGHISPYATLQRVRMRAGTQFLGVGVRNEQLVMWFAQPDADVPMVDRQFIAYRTGVQFVPSGRTTYLGSVLTGVEGTHQEMHLFEIDSPEVKNRRSGILNHIGGSAHNVVQSTGDVTVKANWPNG